jgi:hypothetical protein
VALIDTTLLVVGHGPGALIAAKTLSAHGHGCLIAGHEPIDDDNAVLLDEHSIAILEPDGVLGVLRPYAANQDPFSIAPLHFEQGLKHHCVADMLVTVYDGMTFEAGEPTDDAGDAVHGVLSDGRSSWDVRADAFLDVTNYPANLNLAIQQAARFSSDLALRLG